MLEKQTGCFGLWMFLLIEILKISSSPQKNILKILVFLKKSGLHLPAGPLRSSFSEASRQAAGVYPPGEGGNDREA